MSTATAEFQFELVSHCLTIRAAGRYILEQKEEAFRMMEDAIHRHSAKALLVDVRDVPGPYTFMDYIGMGENAGRYLSKVPVAVVAGAHQVDPDRIGKVVAQNRGANVEVFTDRVEAQAWLQKYLSPAG
jgi:NMD protein affecting ribosome stability and mRNA decay